MRNLIPLHPAEYVIVNVVLDLNFLGSGRTLSGKGRSQATGLGCFVRLRAKHTLMRLLKIVSRGRRCFLLCGDREYKGKKDYRYDEQPPGSHSDPPGNAIKSISF